ncbi:MAG: hypothetical protein KKH01_03580 [Firmicutes bacterium]|nr:hypothetical protein [Bacillota bacterium]
MNKRRILIGLLTGALLGVLCIVGAQLRYTQTLEPLYLFAFWFNRVLIGLVIGLASRCFTLPKAILRGAILGAFVSFAFYCSTAFFDTTGFIAGIIYGMIIEFVTFKFSK